MGKRKKDQEIKEGRKRKICLLISIVFFLFIIVISFAREKGLLKVWETERDLAELHKEIGKIDRENMRLEREIISLRSNNASYIEKVAREELGLVKPGEVVYEFLPATRKTTGFPVDERDR